MVTYSREKYKPHLMKMWKASFPDSDEFIRFYFDKIYKEEETLVYVENELPVSALQMIPYQIKIGKEIYDSSYISGAMTLPQHRKKGYMHQLLQTSFEVMKEKENTFSFLIPQSDKLFDYYEKYGYKPAFPKSWEVIDLKLNQRMDHELVSVHDEYNAIEFEKLFVEYSWCLSQKKNVVLKTLDNFKHFLEELFLDGGRLFHVADMGMAFIQTWKEKIAIKEMFCANDYARSLLLGAIRHEFDLEEAVLIGDNKEHLVRNTGMIKILEEDKFTSLMPEYIYMSMMLD